MECCAETSTLDVHGEREVISRIILSLTRMFISKNDRHMHPSGPHRAPGPQEILPLHTAPSVADGN